MKCCSILPNSTLLDSPPLNTAATIEPSRSILPFMRLPPELRQMIYQEAMPKPRRQPTPHDIHAVYFENMKDVWKDQPSPFLFLSKQIHAEFSDTLKNSEVCLNVTGQGITLDDAGLSASIAQNACRNLDKISHLRVDVWPPHPDRPVEILYIWKDLQRLRNKIVNCSKIQRLTLTFGNKGQFNWDDDGKLRHMFDKATGIWAVADLTSLLDLFASVSNVRHAEVGFDKAIGKSQVPQCRKLLKYATRVATIMCGSSDSFWQVGHIQDFDWKYLEMKLKQAKPPYHNRSLLQDVGD
ncbi:MAG: hypothetical protein Q9199_005976 [Rusavskia elegans]